MTADDRPSVCCGVCPPIAGGGYDCTCEDNPRCPRSSVTDNARDEAVWIIESSVPDDVPGYRIRYAEKAADALIERGLLAAGRAETTTPLQEWAGAVTDRFNTAAETTTATAEDAAQVIESTRHYNGSRSFIVPADAARALADAGLLRGGSDG